MQQQQERERREKERRELERRELERERERERERLIQQQQQRYATETTKHLGPPVVVRDRSPLRNGVADPLEIRIKEEPRSKEEEMLGRTDPRYHPYLRHPAGLQPPSVGRMLGHGLATHYPHTGLYPPDPFYRYDPLRYVVCECTYKDESRE